MKKLFIIPLLLFSLTGMAACSPDDTPVPETGLPTIPEEPGDEFDNPDGPDGSGNAETPSEGGKILVAYFSAQRHTQAVAECIVELTGADIYCIEAAEPYAANPYDDSDRIRNEAYNDLRPGVANLLDAERIAQYDTIFIGSSAMSRSAPTRANWLSLTPDRPLTNGQTKIEKL